MLGSVSLTAAVAWARDMEAAVGLSSRALEGEALEGESTLPVLLGCLRKEAGEPREDALPALKLCNACNRKNGM